ncbi:histidine phosphatase family protein [Aeromonas hydrophila]|uniref:histidine phosphatase family protein n=1 Tax=Aeromonas hydrophila TaxID=644 RepID=UPI0019201B84|nr:histidine phosphatase family protein [Aeromonas hydrophila]MBL0573288.1 histidine phosphatase family protein [Aeromonas hydrophila]WVM44249.1 histidine phosphatase family protein [Aeromonas hydrophila]
MRLILLRHGETIWNIDKRLQGHDNAPLSPRGIAQAKSIIPSIQKLSPARVVMSDLGRARQTAEIIGYGDAPADAGLRELNMGVWTGKCKPDLIDTYPKLYQAWRAGTFTPEGGEEWHMFVLRVKNSLRLWLQAGDGDLLAVVHSGVIRAACFTFLNLKPAQILPVTPGSLTILNFASITSQPQLEAYNVGMTAPDIQVAD